MFLGRTKQDYLFYASGAAVVIAVSSVLSLISMIWLHTSFLPVTLIICLFFGLMIGAINYKHYRNSRPDVVNTPEVKKVTRQDPSPLSQESIVGYTPSIDDTQDIPPVEPLNEDGASDVELTKMTKKQLAIMQIQTMRELAQATVSQTVSQETLHEEDHPATYQHRFHIMKLILEISGVAIGLIVLTVAVFMIDDIVPRVSVPAQVYLVLAGLWAIAMLSIWYAWLSWFNRDFVANKDRCSMPRPMPWLFPDQAPTIDTGISSIQIHRGVIDKLFGTCTLRMDSPSEGDEMFAVVRWLKFPDELRDALGITPPNRKRLLRRHKKSV